MDSSDRKQEGNFGYLINPYGKPISRLTRSKNNNQYSSTQTQSSQSIITKPSLLERKGRSQQTQSKNDDFVPVRLSDLSSNVVFKDIDSPTKSISRKSIKQQSKSSLIIQDKQLKPQIISQSGNSSTETIIKPKKLSIEKIQTPIKNKQSHQILTPTSSEAGSLTSQNRFSRKRQVQPQRIDKHNEINLSINSEKSQLKEGKSITDRSIYENNRKIERKSERNRRQLKFSQKKQINTQSEIIMQQHEESKKIGIVEKKPLDYKAQNEPKYYKLAQHQKVFEQNKSSSGQIKPKKALQEKINTKIEVYQEYSKSLLRKSTLIIFVIKRLYFTQIQRIFNRLKFTNHQVKIKYNKQSLLLSLSIISISKKNQNGLLRWSYDILKTKFSQIYVSDLKNVFFYKPVNRIQSSLNILQKIHQSNVRKVFQRIKNKFLWSSNQVKSLILLDQFYKKKSSQINHFIIQMISTKAKLKMVVLKNLTLIINNLNRSKVRLSFLRIFSSFRSQSKTVSYQKKMSRSHAKQSSNSSQYQQKTQKLKLIVKSITENLTSLNKKLKQTQNRTSEQKKQLQQKIFSLKQINQSIQSQLNAKKIKIQEMQEELKSISYKVQTKPVKEQLQMHDQKLYSLCKIYMENFKDQKDLIVPTKIIQEYKLSIRQCSKSFQQWQLLTENISLKRQIATYQQSRESIEFTARKIAMGEQKIVANLLRNYLRMQYFWQWLHVSAQSQQFE